ncbi:MAG: tetratricopeptide repeat protein, partial [Aureispira sp.]
MPRFFLLLFLFVGCNNSILALDYPSNLDSIIDTHRANNQLPKVVAYLDKVLSKAEKEYGIQSDTVAFYLAHQANIIKELGRYKEAYKLFEKVVTIYEQHPSKNQIKLTTALVDWARAHINSREHPSAQELLHRALEVVQQTTPLDTIALARVYNNLSANCWLSNKDAEGLEFGKKALDLLSKSKLESTLDFLELALCYENMAGSYGGIQKYEEAVAMQKKSIELRQEHFPPQKQRFASSFSNLARFYGKMNRYNEALPYHQRSADMMRKNKGDRHPETAIYLNNLANCYTYLHQFDKSEPLLLEALDIFKETLGPEHPNSIVFTNNIGGLYGSMRELEKAKIYFQKALTLGEKVFGETHPNSITFKSSLAGVLMDSKKYDEALQLFSEAAETSKVVFGPKSLQVIISYNQMAKCYLFLGADFYTKALEYVDHSITLNAVTPIHIEALENNLEDLSNRTLRSNIQFQKALEVRSKIQQAIYKDTKDQQFLINSYKTQKVLAYYSQQLQNTVYTRQDKLRT